MSLEGVMQMSIRDQVSMYLQGEEYLDYCIECEYEQSVIDHMSHKQADLRVILLENEDLDAELASRGMSRDDL